MKGIKVFIEEIVNGKHSNIGKGSRKIAGKLSTISLNNLIFNFVKNMDLNNLLSLFQMFCKKTLMKRQR